MRPGWIFGSDFTRCVATSSTGRSDLYGDELGLQLVRVYGYQFFHVLREQVLDVEVTQVVGDVRDEPGSIVQVCQGQEVLLQLHQPGVSDRLDDATVVPNGAGTTRKVTEKGGEDDFVMGGLLDHGEDPQQATDAQLKVKRCQSTASQIFISRKCSERHGSVALRVLQLRHDRGLPHAREF